MERIFISNNEQETINIGIDFSKDLIKNDCIAVNGNLGAGKTHLIKGICHGLGVQSNTLSPTFSLLNVYSGNVKIYHFDFYRIKDISELFEIGFDEYLLMDGIVIIEWAYLFKEVLPSNHIRINIDYLQDNSRKIRIGK